MASNKELIEKITAAATEKGVDVPETEGKNNNDLTAILKNLKTPTPPAAPKDDEKVDSNVKDDAATDAKAEAENVKVDKKIKRPPFYIAPGKALTTKRGILGPDDEIKAEDLAGGIESIKKWVKTGHVLEG